MKKVPLTLLRSFFALAASSAAAAPIIFSPAVNIAGVTDISTHGTLLAATTFATTQTVNGVTFTGSVLGAGAITTYYSLSGFGTRNANAFTHASANPFFGLPAAYKNMLIGAAYNSTLGSTGTVTLTNLTPGNRYLVQLFTGDPRNLAGTLVRTLQVNGSNSQIVDFNVGNMQGGAGQHVTGVMLADATTASFTVSSPSDGLPQVNAMQLRDVTSVPGIGATGWWTGAAGTTWDAATTANFTTDALGTAGTSDAALAAAGYHTFADTQTESGAPVATAAVTIATGGISTPLALFRNAVTPYTLTSTDAAGLMGTGALLLQGGGGLRLDGTHTLTGPVTVSSGRLTLGSSTALPDTAAVALGNDAKAALRLTADKTLTSVTGGGAAGGNVELQTGSLTLTGDTAETFAGAFTGSGSVTKQGIGALTLSGASTHTGTTTVASGRLNLTGSLAGSALAVMSGTEIAGEGSAASLSLDSATLIVDPATPGALTATAGLTLSGTTTVTLSGPPASTPVTLLSYAGPLTGGDANLTVTNSAEYRSFAITHDATSFSLNYQTGVRTWTGAAADWNVGGATAGWQEGDQLFFTGDTVIFNDPGAPQTVNIPADVAPASISVTNTADYLWTGGGRIMSGALTKAGSGTLTLQAPNVSAGGAAINAGTVISDLTTAGRSVGTGPVSVASGATLVFNNTNTINATPNALNVLSGDGTVKLKFAAGTTARNTLLNNFSAFTGTIQLTAPDGSTGDKWQLNAVNAPGASVVAETGTQVYIPAAQTVILEGVNLVGTGNSEIRGALRILGRLQAPVTLSGDTSVGPEGGTIAGTITNGTASPILLTLGTTNSTGNVIIDGVIGSNIGISKVAAGVTTLLGENSYGTTSITAGTIAVGNAATTAVANQPSTLNAGTGMTGTPGTGDITSTGGTLDLRRSDTALVIPNNISGTCALAVNGVAGSLVTLAGNNSFTGNVTIALGGLRIRSSSGLGSPPATGNKTITMTNGTAGQPSLRLDGSAGDISLPSTFAFSTSTSTGNGGIINEAGNNTIAGPFTLTAGGGATRLRVDAGTLTLSGNVSPSTTGRFLILDGAADGTFSGVLSNNGANIPGLQKEGIGTWTVSGVNTYTAATQVKSGTLMLTGSLAAGSAVTVDAPGTLKGTGTAAGTVTVNGTLAPGASAGTFNAGTTTLNNTLAVEVDGTSADKLMVTGDLILASGSTLTVDLLPGGFTQASYVIAEWTGARTGTFTNVPAGYTVDYTATTAVLRTGTSTPYSAWAALKGLDGTPGKDPAFAADPDGDGVSNGLEFVTDGDPLTAGASGITASVTGGNLVVTFPRRDDAEYLNPTLEFDTDLLGTWTTAADPVNATISSAENGAAPDTVTVSIPVGTEPRLYARLRVIAQ